MARGRMKSLRQCKRRRLAWNARQNKREQVEEQEPALGFFDPQAMSIVAKQSETTQYFDADLVQKLRKEVQK